VFFNEYIVFTLSEPTHYTNILLILNAAIFTVKVRTEFLFNNGNLSMICDLSSMVVQLNTSVACICL
jgi:hypothetical protein